MPITLSCPCGATYQLKDELAGKSVKCPKCGATQRAGGDAKPGGAAPAPGVDPVFARDKFLLRQKHLAISEKYFVWDEAGKVLLFVERPAHVLKSCFALIAGTVAAGVVAAALGTLAAVIPKSLEPLQVAVGLIAGFGALAALLVVAILLSPKRHVTFYRDENKGEPILKVTQDFKYAIINATYTVKDPSDQVLARLTKNYLYNIFRKRWYVYGPEGEEPIAMAMEDSLILSLLRRFLGPLFGLLRTNFIIVRGMSEDVIGEFNRKFTLLDRYVLDMSADRSGTLDRRVAVALGVMLDTGERR